MSNNDIFTAMMMILCFMVGSMIHTTASEIENPANPKARMAKLSDGTICLCNQATSTTN